MAFLRLLYILRPIVIASTIFPRSSSVIISACTYSDTIANSSGCDSIISVALTITNINDSVTVNNAVCTAQQAGANYQWFSCSSGQNISGATSQSFTAVQSGSYKCAITVGNCTDTSSCINAIVYGISEIESQDIHLYPNPNNGLFVIEKNYNRELNVKVLNTLGSIEKEFKTQGQSSSVDITNLAAGVYDVMILDGQQLVKVIKVVKQ